MVHGLVNFSSDPYIFLVSMNLLISCWYHTDRFRHHSATSRRNNELNANQAWPIFWLAHALGDFGSLVGWASPQKESVSA